MTLEDLAWGHKGRQLRVYFPFIMEAGKERNSLTK